MFHDDLVLVVSSCTVLFKPVAEKLPNKALTRAAQRLRLNLNHYNAASGLRRRNQQPRPARKVGPARTEGQRDGMNGPLGPESTGARVQFRRDQPNKARPGVGRHGVRASGLRRRPGAAGTANDSERSFLLYLSLSECVHRVIPPIFRGWAGISASKRMQASPARAEMIEGAHWCKALPSLRAADEPPTQSVGG
jgi:hypothetical protein